MMTMNDQIRGISSSLYKDFIKEKTFDSLQVQTASSLQLLLCFEALISLHYNKIIIILTAETASTMHRKLLVIVLKHVQMDESFYGKIYYRNVLDRGHLANSFLKLEGIYQEIRRYTICTCWKEVPESFCNVIELLNGAPRMV